VKKSALAVLAMVLATPAVWADAPKFSRSDKKNLTTTGQVPMPSSVLSQQTITQSTNPTSVVAGSVSCNAAGLHTDNSYYRGMTLSTFPALTLPQFMVQQVTIGVEQATSTGGTQPVTLNIWKATANPISGGANPPGNNQVATQPVTVSDQSLTLLPMTLTTQPVLLVASDVLAVELFTPSGQAAGNSFFIGSNAAGQSGPSYIKAASCGLATIGDLAGIGFPNMHIVMSVLGNNQTPVELQGFDIK
jgi:hypothetical protein